MVPHRTITSAEVGKRNSRGGLVTPTTGLVIHVSEQEYTYFALTDR